MEQGKKKSLKAGKKPAAMASPEIQCHRSKDGKNTSSQKTSHKMLGLAGNCPPSSAPPKLPTLTLPSIPYRQLTMIGNLSTAHNICLLGEPLHFWHDKKRTTDPSAVAFLLLTARWLSLISHFTLVGKSKSPLLPTKNFSRSPVQHLSNSLCCFLVRFPRHYIW